MHRTSLRTALLLVLLSPALATIACVSSDIGEGMGSEPGGPDAGSGGGVPVPDADAPEIPDEPWITVPSGSFTMGSPTVESCREDDETAHDVTLTRSFLIASRETTQDQYIAELGYNPSYRPECGGQCPVEDLNWHMAVAYCEALSAKEEVGNCYDCTGSQENVQCIVKPEYTGEAGSIYDCPGYRLPTDAEWEYAYRAGTSTSLYSGELGPSSCTGEDSIATDIGWFNKTAQGQMHPVGSLQPNSWGLYDMGGNMQEWTHDFYQADLGTESVVDPVIELDTSGRGVIRGGSFAHAAEDMRGAHRKQQGIDNRGTSLGVRCVRSLDGQID